MLEDQFTQVFGRSGMLCAMPGGLLQAQTTRLSLSQSLQAHLQVRLWLLHCFVGSNCQTKGPLSRIPLKLHVCKQHCGCHCPSGNTYFICLAESGPSTSPQGV